jgi:sRNA-binding protein
METEALTTEETPQPVTAKQQKFEAAVALLAELGKAYPSVFIRDANTEPVPWATGIHRDIAALFPETKPDTIRMALGIYQARCKPAYWRAIKAGAPRFDLHGNQRGEVTPEDEAKAKEEIEKWKARRKQRTKAPGTLENSQKQAHAKTEAPKTAVTPSASSLNGGVVARDPAGTPARVVIESNAPAKAGKAPAKPASISKAKGAVISPHVVVVKRSKAKG